MDSPTNWMQYVHSEWAAPRGLWQGHWAQWLYGAKSVLETDLRSRSLPWWFPRQDRSAWVQGREVGAVREAWAGGGCWDADSTSSLQGWAGDRGSVGHGQIDEHWGKETSKSCCRVFLLSRRLYQGSIQLCAALLLSAAKSKGIEDTSTLQD